MVAGFRSLRSHRWRVMAAVILAVAGVLVGYSHKQHADRLASMAPVLLAQPLPDGTPVELCSSVDGADPTPKPSTRMVCEACLLTAAAGLPERDADLPVPPPTTARLAIAKATAALRTERPPVLHLRGPPV